MVIESPGKLPVQFARPTQEYWHHLLGSSVGPRKDAGKLSREIAWAQTGRPAPFVRQFSGPHKVTC